MATVILPTFNVFASQLLHDLWREDARGEGPSEDGVELVVQAADPHLGEVPVRVYYGLSHHLQS